MPKFGLGKVGDHLPAEGKFKSASGRIDRNDK
jgi:hypothetical protein